MEKTYYVYLHSPAGTEIIGSGDYESCKKIKENKDAQWEPGYMWFTEIVNDKQKEASYFN